MEDTLYVSRYRADNTFLALMSERRIIRRAHPPMLIARATIGKSPRVLHVATCLQVQYRPRGHVQSTTNLSAQSTFWKSSIPMLSLTYVYAYVHMFAVRNLQTSVIPSNGLFQCNELLLGFTLSLRMHLRPNVVPNTHFYLSTNPNSCYKRKKSLWQATG